MFGFTEGADIGAEGEKAIEFETTTSFGMRGGTFGAIEQEIEFESVPSQFFGYDLSAHGLMQRSTMSTASTISIEPTSAVFRPNCDFFWSAAIPAHR